MKKLAALTAAGALALGAFAGSAAAAPKSDPAPKAYGAVIKDATGYSFGQLRNLAPKEHVTPSNGAKYFVEEGLIEAHAPLL